MCEQSDGCSTLQVQGQKSRFFYPCQVCGPKLKIRNDKKTQQKAFCFEYTNSQSNQNITHYTKRAKAYNQKLTMDFLDEN